MTTEDARVRRRYDRIAWIYDVLEWPMEQRVRHWRAELWRRVEGGTILELGVGTGKNIPYHPPRASVTAIDISEKMLRRARRRAARFGTTTRFLRADAQALPFDDGSFDAVVATFVFCSVPDPVRGLSEALRVLRPGGRLWLLEHVLSRQPMLRTLMRWLDPIPYHVWGAHIDRETVENVRRAGFSEVEVDRLFLDVVVQIRAHRPPRGSGA